MKKPFFPLSFTLDVGPPAPAIAPQSPRLRWRVLDQLAGFIDDPLWLAIPLNLLISWKLIAPRKMEDQHTPRLNKDQ